MPPLVHEAAVPHLADFIDPVGELIAAILDVHLRRRVWNVAAVDIREPEHGGCSRSARPLVDAERLELAVQRRALHADELGGTRDIAAEPADLRDEILPLERFSRLAQRKAHQPLTAVPARPRP